jgi:hypothetical protein
MAQGRKLNFRERMEKLRKDSKSREQCFKDLITHLKSGYSMDCFGPMSETTIMEFCKEYPGEFDKESLVEACRGGKNHWEDIGHRQAQGSCLGNSRTWFYNMSNRYGWRDKVDIEAEHKGSVAVNVISYASKKASS